MPSSEDDPTRSTKLSGSVAALSPWVTSALHQTPGPDFKKMAKDDVQDSFWTIETNTFLDHVLGWKTADNDVRNVLHTLNLSSAQWLSLPKVPKPEKELYSSFADTANAIVAACSATNPIVELALDISWQASPNKIPKSLDRWSPQIRPDLLAVVGLKDAPDEFKRLDTQIQDLEHQLGSGPEEEAEKEELKLQRKELLKKCELWWLRVHVPVEMKPKDSEEEMLEGILQLCSYMRMVLAEQLDRRFAIGLLLCKSKLTVWMCDRSGLVGTRTAIDIHAEPKKFIKVIISLSRLNPSRLGWDTTMRIYRMETATYHFSTDKDVTVDYYGASPHETTWAIQGPRSDGNEGEDRYLTVKALSTVRAQVMEGRATIVWLVVNERTMERFVLKQSWRPEMSQTKATFHKSLSKPPSFHICDIVNSVDIRVMDDEQGGMVVDDTANHIRRGVEVRASSLKRNKLPKDPGVSELRSTKRKKPELDESQPHESFLYVTSTSSEVLEFSVIADGRSATNRVLTRTLMRTYGWPIKFFKDVPELVNTLIDAVKGHRDYWFSLMLHQDVSTGNVLICPRSDVNVEDTCGKLIDLDCSKTSDTRVEYPAPGPPDKDTAGFLQLRWQVSVTDEAAGILIARYPSDFLIYINVALSMNPDLRTANKKLTAEDLFLETPFDRPPAWDGHLLHIRHKTGTRAFMSAEIIYLSNVRYEGTEALRSTGRVVHSVIHDLESFFWVLLYLCLTRDGPGGGRRIELSINEPLTEETKPIYAAVYCLFDSEDDHTLWNNKRLLFNNPDDLDEIILKCIHPYFDSLKPLISRWWKTLRFGYMTYNDYVAGSLHDRVLTSLEDELGKIQSKSNLHSNLDADEVARMENKTDKEIQRRKDDLEFIQLRVRQLDESLKRQSPHAGQQRLPATPLKDN
ncbi:hypothetical protein HETIRDRAFT_460499 [Heterobasidion irregulare TC 32-1]|uniref:Fungal-type protein kinase domain-containing protein n=1 Tax=Heterobasidion irregulare (strain TC 32-1) TaxID=747525 RepID=W4JTW6_HETIT|nr:uncharacterized protein HETIRDRAFT_460499 [Heterobasidion irregulare TC 32-1]ETW77007.1 hypothetical protein HETIRDRAFT_460499 [Heterobasidion irregulare TC 32-1]